jgi:DNA-binding NtrC family response regulator
MTSRILLVEDEINMARTLAKNLERAGYAVTHAANGEAALGTLAQESFDVILTDLKMPVLDGMGLLRAIHERKIATSVIVLTGYGTIESAVEAMKLGAADYLIKDAHPQQVLLTVERTLKLQALERENARLRREIVRFEGIGELVGNSDAMQAVYRLVDAVSQTKSTVLISGESGTG